MALAVLIGTLQAAPVVFLGKISVKGHEPFTFLALTTFDGRIFKLTGEQSKPLYSRQGNQLFVWGELASQKVGEGKKGAFQAPELQVTRFEMKTK